MVRTIKKPFKSYDLNGLIPCNLPCFFVDPLGLEPRLFCTKNRRVASYTMGQLRNAMQRYIFFENNKEKTQEMFFNLISV